DYTQTYPDTVGAHIPKTMGFMLNAHFLNVSAQDYMATLTVTLHVAPAGSVTQYAGVVFMNYASLVITPSSQPQTVGTTCTIPQDMNALGSGSHMHMRANHFTAVSNGQTLYETTAWSDPVPNIYNPPLQLAKGANVTFNCTYVNDTGMTL